MKDRGCVKTVMFVYIKCFVYMMLVIHKCACVERVYMYVYNKNIYNL